MNPGPDSTPLGKTIGKNRRRGPAVFIFLAALLVLLSLFSAGFFLYSAMVVIVLLLLSAGLASSGLLGLHVQRTLSAVEIALGDHVDAFLTIHNDKALSAFQLFWKDHIHKDLDLEGTACFFQTLGPNRKTDFKYRLHSTRRGFFNVGPVVIESGGFFGIVRRFLVSRPVEFITVFPRIVSISKALPQGQRPVHQVPRRRSIFEDPSRFMGMREYRPGDSLRRIHWRATARSQKIQVKLFEPTVLSGILLAVDMGLESYPRTREHPGEIDPLLEKSVTAAASLAEYILAEDQRAGLLSNGGDAAAAYSEDWQGGSFHRLDEALEKTSLSETPNVFRPVEVTPSKGRRQYEQLLTALARLTPGESITLPQLLQRELPRLPRSMVLAVVTPNLDGELTAALQSLKRSGIDTAVIWICEPEDDSTPDSAPPNIPIYRVCDDTDIEQLGGQSL
ncbi:MAG: DUF58 domain-containing protein [bacterium]|nr:DUF58 domain-containing protein [bacterium]